MRVLGAALNFYDAHAVSVQIEDTNPRIFIIFLLQNRDWIVAYQRGGRGGFEFLCCSRDLFEILPPAIPIYVRRKTLTQVWKMQMRESI